MPKVELEYKCKNCKSLYPATVSFAGKVEDMDLGEHESRCPNCGTWNCADPSVVEEMVAEIKKEKNKR
jgi:DNA-directed RNA polymerase subunit RPC12/RpoP